MGSSLYPTKFALILAAVRVADQTVISAGTSSYVGQLAAGGLTQTTFPCVCVSTTSWAWAVRDGFEVSASIATAASITATSNSGASLMPQAGCGSVGPARPPPARKGGANQILAFH